MDSDRLTEMMYLLPWALQEEVVPSPALTRQDRFEKAMLGFKLLLHYYHLSAFPAADGVSQRFHGGVTEAVTFAEDSDWPRIFEYRSCFSTVHSCCGRALVVYPS
jgi:hypothetical protein